MVTNGVLTKVQEEDFERLKNDPTSFWRGVKVVDSYAFELLGFFSHPFPHILDIPNGVVEIRQGAFQNWEGLQMVYLPRSLKDLGAETFMSNTELQSVEIGAKLKEIKEGTFCGCQKLSKIVLPKSLKLIGRKAFADCYSLQYVNLPPKIEIIPDSCFKNCKSLKSVDLSNYLISIEANAFEGCINLEEIHIPYGVESIETMAFCDCENLSYVYIPKTVYSWGKNAFKNCPLRFVSVGNDGSIILSEKPIQSNQSKCYDIHNVQNWIKGFSFSGDMLRVAYEDGSSDLDNILKAANIAEKNKIQLTENFVLALKSAGQLDVFCNSNFKMFHQIQKLLPENLDESKLTALLIFAYDIGCFSQNEKLVQRSTEWLKERLIKKEISLFDLSIRFADWKPTGENEEFSNFLFSKDQNSNETIFEQILQERDYSNFMLKIYEQFLDENGRLSQGGRFRDEKGKLRFAIAHKFVDEAGNEHTRRKNHIPTVKLFKDYFHKTGFIDIITDEDIKIADELSRWAGMKQADFLEAKSIMQEYQKNNIPANILGFHLSGFPKEIEEYKAKTDALAKTALQDASEVVENLSQQAQKFTFDWIEKNDPMNFCLGLYCDCCATLNNVGYGIMKSVFVNPNIQNLVIKTRDGFPVAKSTAYVNSEEGYVVFNNVEVANQISDEEKDDIYLEYLRGIEAFAHEYNKQHPTKPITVMTVGMHCNDLEKQIKNAHARTRIRQGINFGNYGSFLRDYSGDWVKAGQYKLWEKKKEGRNDKKEL